MNATRWAMLLLWIAAVAAGAACGRGAETPVHDDDHEGEHAGAEHEADAGAEPGEVHIDPSMLRDLRITTAPVESRTDRQDVTLLGELAVNERAYAEVGVPVAARVTRLLVEPGQAVRDGQLLLELQSPELGRARAEYLSAEGRVTLAEQHLARTRDLAAERIAPARAVQEAEAEAVAARAALRAAQAMLDALGVPPPAAAETADERTASTFGLYAPVRGTVIERAAVLGQMLDPATPAYRIADLSSLWLTVHASEQDAVRIAPRAPARLSFPALPGQELAGTVAVIGRQVARDSRTVPIRVDVPNPGERLRPGMSAAATMPVGDTGRPILTVPAAALQRVGGDWCVFVPRDAATFEIRRVGRGRDLGAEVEVLSGVAAGEMIVVDGAFLLKSHAERRDTGDHAH